MDESPLFYVKDCALTSIAIGEKANSLIELRDGLIKAPQECIYYHFWGGRLKAQFVHPEDHNDFAGWVHHVLHDLVLAEKLAALDPTWYESLEVLRKDLLDTINERIKEGVILYPSWYQPFHFIKSKIIVFETPLTISKPEELPHILHQMTTSSIFYHFIDARRRNEGGRDDFSVWLKNFGDLYTKMIERIREIDIYFCSLPELKNKLMGIVANA